MDKLIYIGKSNKKFTNGRLYEYMEFPHFSHTLLSIQVKTNRNILEYFDGRYFDFFYTNFRFINEQEYKQLIREQKLKKINNVN